PSENANENISDGLTSERDKIMWQTLTAWRGKQAQTEGVALSKILSDDTLLDLIRLTPETDLDLQGVHGLGQVRIGRYATDILSVCYPFSDSLEDEAVSTRKLMRELLEWCTKTARIEDIEQHRIFSKVTLRAIAAKKPRTMAALAEIHGVGEEKLAKYGETVLEIVEEFLI
uniref:HRDC domain-containing protein n=1 Tax=Neisseria weixii TaxID=1853276 RepID=UPI00359FFE26